MQNKLQGVKSRVLLQGKPRKYPNTKITISQKCVNIFVLNCAHSFRRQPCKSVLLCAVFT